MSILGAIQNLLANEGRALNAKQLAVKLQASGGVTLGGMTPWKTIGARLAEDIRSNPETPFLRIGRGLYGLRAWPDARSFEVKPRVINPLDEDIRVVERAQFLNILGHPSSTGFYDRHYATVLQHSFIMRRQLAEASEEVVQLIPSFLIFRGEEVLSFHRTKKSPEQRLHNRYSIIFGGHLQDEDDPGLFHEDREHADKFLFRELHEELSFSSPPLRSEYVGILHLQASAFERQHAGLVFALEVPPEATAQSMEPGYHSGLKFLEWKTIGDSPVISDRWSEACIKHIGLDATL